MNNLTSCLKIEKFDLLNMACSDFASIGWLSIIQLFDQQKQGLPLINPLREAADEIIR